MDCLTTLSRLADINGYTDRGHRAKLSMHSAGRAFLQKLARDLGLQTHEREIRSNRGGLAVSGEVTLDAPGLYLWLQESCVGARGVTITYRYQPAVGSSASAHGPNHWRHVRDLIKPDRYRWFLADLQTVRARGAARVAAC